MRRRYANSEMRLEGGADHTLELLDLLRRSLGLEDSSTLWGDAFGQVFSLGKAFPDNASCVDEGKGCDIVFTLNGRTYHIEVKSSEEDGTGFMLGTSEIRCAREIAQKRRRREREQYFVLKVDHALTSEPKFMLLPNPYDPAHQDRFVIVDDGARVSYRP